MRYGAMNFPVKSIADEINDFGSMGFDFLELTLDPPGAHHSTVRAQRSDILQQLKRHAMGLVCHLPTFVYTADLSDRIRNASLDEMMASLEVARLLEAEKVVCHPGIIGGMGALVMEVSKKHAYESLKAIARKARQLGLCLCLENMFPRYQSFVEPEDFIPIFDHCPEVRMTLDVGHAHIEDATGDRVIRFLGMHGSRLRHIHLSDNNGKKDEHLPVGKGNIAFKRIIKILKTMGYDDTMTLEIFSEDRRELVQTRNNVDGMFTSRRMPFSSH